MKLSREDWLQKGLAVLATYGSEDLKIDRLCKHLKVTKGSFYHYFAHRDEYLAALLEYWQNHYTNDLIRAVSGIADPSQRGRELNAKIGAIDLRPETALRSWGRKDERVAAVVAQVDRERIDYLTQLIVEQTHSVGQAELMAKLVYAHFVGCQHLGELVTQFEWQQMDELLQDMVARLLSPL